MFRRRPGRRPPVFRRRFPRRPGGPPHRPPLPPRVRRVLMRANKLMASERFTEAAAIFEELSEKADQHGMPVRAADLALQASRACLAAGDPQAAVEWGEKALRLLVRGGRADRVPRVLPRMINVLRQHGYDAQADQLEQEAEKVLDEAGLSLAEMRLRAPQATEQFAAQRGTLPAQCSGCGASLVPDEVEWHDARTAECLYCGTVCKTT